VVARLLTAVFIATLIQALLPPAYGTRLSRLSAKDRL
jgi:hypothetical protein